MQGKIKAYESILDLVGNTPLIKIRKTSKNFKGDHYIKFEGLNPGHSHKDRVAVYIIEEAEKRGILKPGQTIIETTSGNTGFSLSMVCLIKGYKCVLAISSKSSQDKINTLKVMGAEIHICPSNVASNDPKSYYEVAKRLNKEIPNSIYINQYFNKLNIDAHYKTTGVEIWKQTSGQITHLVACSGTGGLISGVGRFLKEKNSKIRILGVDAYGSVLKKYHETGEFDENEIYPYSIEGLGKNLIPESTDFKVIDKFIKVNDRDSAYMAKIFTQNEGIFVGYTSGSVIQAIHLYNKLGEFDENSKVIAVLPDHGSRYLSKIYNDDWMKQKGFL